MKYSKRTAKRWCLIFGQLLGTLTLCIGVEAQEIQHLNRGPASYLPADDITPLPLKQEVFLNKLLVEDNAGVLKSVGQDLRQWEEQREYAENWNLQSTGLYQTPDRDSQRNYLNKKMVKYLDRRLAGEVKKAEKGSALHSVKQIQKTLRPKMETSVSKRVKIKFKARVLEGEAVVRVVNPWVRANAKTNVKGYREVNIERKIQSLDLNTHVKYQIDQENWTATIDRPVGKGLMGRISSSQGTRDRAFGRNSDQRIEFLFKKSF